MKSISGVVECRGQGCGIAVEVDKLEDSVLLAGDIVIVDRMPTAKFILRYRQNIKGVITSQSDYKTLGHSAILLREYGIPLVVLDKPFYIKPGSAVEIENENIYCDRTRNPVILTEQNAVPNAPAEAKTPDGRAIKLLSNAWNLEDVAEASRTETSGIGVFRTEGIALDKPPSFEEQCEIYKNAVRLMGEKELYFRLFDFCADKPFAAGGDMTKVYKAQLAALLVAAAPGTTLKVIVPNVNYTSQVTGLRRLAVSLKEVMRKKGQKTGTLSFGAMIESTQAAAVACEICAASDFVAVGLNGLCRLSDDFPLYRESYNERAILRICKFIIYEAEKLGCQLTFCGDLLNEAELLKNLVGLGVKRISVSVRSAEAAAKVIAGERYLSSVLNSIKASGKYIPCDENEEPFLKASIC